MKRILQFPTLSFLLLFISLTYVSGQTIQAPYSIGFIGGSKQVNDSTKILYNPYSTAFSGTKTDANGVVISTGFPYPIGYFPTVFSRELFSSKGYYPDVVQLNWEVKSLTDRIGRFLVYRKPLGGENDSVLVANLPSDQYSWSDEYADKGVLYKYTIFAKGLADDLRLNYFNYIEATGFTYPVGTASGRITFEGGTAVEGVTVVAEASGNLTGKSVHLDGADDYLWVPHRSGHKEMELNTGFTMQMWTKFEGGSTPGTLFSKGTDYALTYNGNQLDFTVGSTTLSLPFTNPADTFFFVTATYSIDSLLLSVQVNENTSYESKMAAGAKPAANTELLLFGKGNVGNYYNGYLDEIRFWNKKLTTAEVKRDFNRYISGNEEGLSAYWRLSAGVAAEFFDLSRKGNEYNENHGGIAGGNWSTHIPPRSQLGFKGITDEDGNYSIAGFPYETGGSQYKFIPMYGVHQFDPAQQIRFVGDGAAIHNQIDFTDISSFTVSGTVKYRNTNFPVAGVYIRIDGKTSVDREGNVIETDNLGRFEVDVPIGRHSLQIGKNQHVFENDGRFPPLNSSGNIVLYDYQAPVSGIEFIDTTLVKVVGRMAGGPVEAAKQIGFGESKNNIGYGTITMTTEKGYDLTLADSIADYSTNEKHIINKAQFIGTSPKDVKVMADTATGEYVAYLLPEKYKVKGVTAGTYTFGEEHNVTIDLTSSIWQEEVNEDTVGMAVNGYLDNSYPPTDSSKYSDIFERRIADTTWIVGVDTFKYQLRQDFIYRVKPTVNVMADTYGSTVFGDTVFVYEDENQGIRTEVPLVSGGSYTFGHPVFSQRRSYKMYLELYEQYANANNGKTDKVPVTDGKLEIVNNLAVKNDKVTMLVNNKGKAVYQFTAGLPETNQDAVTPANSYTKTISITAFSGSNGGIKTIWRDGNPFRGFVFGGLPTGNNFVTNGPTEMLTILRDPPGSGSYAYLSSGNTTYSSSSWDVSNTFSQEDQLTFHLGAEVKVFAGIGAGTITETEYQHDIEVGWSSEESWNSNNVKSTSLTNSKTWTTSSSSDYVGAAGDVFVGRSTNLVYGKSFFVEPIPVAQCTSCSDQEYSGFKLGIKEGLRINPEFATSFIYTQDHIENTLVPNLKDIRNNILVYSPNPASINPTTEPVYVSLVPTDDPRFGTANNDKIVWGTDAVDNMDDWGSGPSYVIRVPQSWIDDQKFVNDTIHYFNQQIKGWEFWLAENEKQKVEAKQDENISFDAGTTYEQSTETVNSQESTTSFEWFINPSLAFSTGGSFNKFGVSNTIQLAYGHGESSSDTNGSEESTTYGFVLEDDNAGDYFSIDVKKPADGFGPVFKLRAGVTSCPYEPGQTTQYFEPGQHVLQEATMKREVPVMQVDNAVVKDVPENRAAEYILRIQNNSESEESGWFTLSTVDSSNPFGAELEIDGEPIADGRSFIVHYGQTLQKTLKVKKGQSDKMDYEDLQLVLSSLCDGNLADTVQFSTYFMPGCSEVVIDLPKNQWVMNTNNAPTDTLQVKIKDYDLNYDNFTHIAFQYKSTATSQWTTNMFFYNPSKVTTAEYNAKNDPKTWISGPSINYNWDMHSLPDRTYDIRAKAVCELGPGSVVETPTAALTGIKDVKRPKLFGSPQPADGILSANDEIMVQFDEQIEAGLLTPFNFSVQGVLNGTEINHNTSIKFDGTNDFVKIPSGLDLTDRSFTIEFWLRKNVLNREMVVFSQGTVASQAFEIGFNSSNQLFVNFAGQEITSTQVYNNTDWHHYAVMYNAPENELFAYYDDQYALESIGITSEYKAEGEIAIGKSLPSENRFLQGNVHELRIWTKAKQQGEVYAAMYNELSGSEIGLVGYWPMDEAFGSKAQDKARYRHALLHADWLVEPAGKALVFDGNDDYMEFNTASTVVITEEMDYSVEFWFKAAPGQTNAVMFSSGKGDGTDTYNKHSASIGFNSSGKIYFASNGNNVAVNTEKDFRDNNWHHFALSLNRKANTNIYLDGEQLVTTPSSAFKGLSGAKMWLGARGFKLGAVTVNHDRFFEGSIDEFRIWNLSQKGEQFKLNRTAKLAGNEMGLVAYYPFEEYATVSGIKLSQTSLSDQWQNPNGSNGGTAQLFAGADFTDDAPNLKDARPLQNVDFDWVVNGDKIIITPAASMAGAIEKRILEITVSGVEDKYENRLASPATWTVFVDKNQVKWSEATLSFEKKLYDPKSFKVEVVNHGGTQQSFNIENLPAWLKAQPSSGVLEPLSTVQITFTIDEGLNTGYYSEDIFLSSDFDFKEKLHLDLRVFEEEPNWSVNPEDFQYSMNIIAQLEIDGILSSDKYDKVAAFVDGECRGVAYLEYVEQYDMYEVFLDVFSNQEFGDNIELRVWNASEGVEHHDVQPNYGFTANTVKGIPSVPERIVAGSTYSLALNFNKGWSWISFNLISTELADVNSLLSDIQAAPGDQAKGQTTVDVYTKEYGWQGSLSQNGGFKIGQMYMLKLNQAGLGEILGQEVPKDTQIGIHKGWNWIGFNPRFNMAVNEAFSGFSPANGDIVKGQYAFAVYDGGLGWIGTLKYLKPGEGYMFKSTNNGQLVYPETSLLENSRLKEDVNPEKSPWTANYAGHPFNMSVIAQLDAEAVDGWILAAFSGNECRATVAPIADATGRALFFLTITGETNGEAIHFRLYNPETNQTFAVNEQLTFVPDQLLGNLQKPYVLTFDHLQVITNPSKTGEIKVKASPNPFHDLLILELEGLENQQPKVSVRDLTGRWITNIPVRKKAPDTIEWDGKNNNGISVSAGVYIITVEVGETRKVIKVVKR